MSSRPGEKLRRLHVLLSKRIGKDVPIEELYAELMPHVSWEVHSRDMQQHVGAHISILNKRLTDYVIVPGNTKRTYKLAKKDA